MSRQNDVLRQIYAIFTFIRNLIALLMIGSHDHVLYHHPKYAW